MIILARQKIYGNIRDGNGRICFIPTPTLYCGYGQGRLANIEGYKYDRVGQYKTLLELEEDSIALDGKFLAREEYIESAGVGATLFVRFRGTKANLIMAPEGRNVFVRLFWNNLPLPEKIRGSDVDSSGMARIKKPKMHNLLKDDLMEGILSIRAEKGKFRAYAFSFSGCYHEEAIFYTISVS